MTIFRRKHKDEEDSWNSAQAISCPVCKTHLGYKLPSKIETFECKDCNTAYTYYPKLKLPIGHPHSQDKNICKCSSCDARRKSKSKSQS
jgi:rubrerythrin